MTKRSPPNEGQVSNEGWKKDGKSLADIFIEYMDAKIYSVSFEKIEPVPETNNSISTQHTLNKPKTRSAMIEKSHVFLIAAMSAGRERVCQAPKDIQIVAETCRQ